ncbi:oligosaccharide flippase family protein [bacterium]|nr:oligosaccharide flippase family protein [bacterium]
MGASPKNAAALALMKVFPTLASLTLFLVAARVFSLDEFGVFSLTTVIVALISQLCYVGFFEFSLKNYNNTDALDTSRVIGFIFAILLAAITWISAPLLAAAFRSPAMEDLLKALSWMPLVVMLCTVFMSKLYSEGRYVIVAAATFVSEAIALALALAALAIGWGLWAFVVQRSVASAIQIAILWERSRWRPRLHMDAKSSRQFFTFAPPMGLDHLIGFMALYLSDILLGLFVSPAMAGVYRFGARIVAAAVSLLTDPARTLSWVRFAQIGEGRNLSKELVEVQGFASIIFAACLGGLAAIASPLVLFAAGPEWGPAALVIVTHCLIWMLMMPLNIAIEPALGMKNATRLLPMMRAIFAITSTIAIALVARQGVEALALAMIAPGVIQAGVLMIVARAQFGVSLRGLLKTNLPIWLSAAIMFGVITAIGILTRHLPLVAQLLAEVSIGVLTFAVLTYILNRRYFDFFAGLILSRLRRKGGAAGTAATETVPAPVIDAKPTKPTI